MGGQLSTQLRDPCGLRRSMGTLTRWPAPWARSMGAKLNSRELAACSERLAMAAWAAALLVALVPQLARAVVRKPHIFLLYVDDWGWANVGYHREVPTPEVSTPAIDDIVAGGIQLNRM